MKVVDFGSVLRIFRNCHNMCPTHNLNSNGDLVKVSHQTQQQIMVSTQKSNSRKLLPIGIQDFRTIRNENYYYVDKTQLIHQLVRQGRHYFLSRPRRFGKSLLLDTIRLLFEGEEELFKGLAIHNSWDWSDKHPVLRISFGGRYNKPAEIEEHILIQLQEVENAAGVTPPDTALSGQVRLRRLLRSLHQVSGHQVVVLVDEYDKPILDFLDDPKLAKANRDYLSGFYGIIKDSANHVRFVLVTGVSMFSKVNLFSGLNNLDNLSLLPDYAAICGYTEADLDEVFAPELEGLDRDEIRRWYNGYNWLGDERVYNPYDVLYLFKNRKFASYWFRTGTPTFLYKIMTQTGTPAAKLENGGIGENRLTRFDVEDIELRSLMFQSGYLTIGEEDHVAGNNLYTLEFPNLEVQMNFNTGFLDHIGLDEVRATQDAQALLKLFASNDFDEIPRQIRSMYSGIPHRWYANNDIDQYEGYYVSVLYTYLRAAGADVSGEVSSSHGDADLVLKQNGQVFVMETKVAEDESDENVSKAIADAIKQIRERGYADPYQGQDTSVHIIGMVFGKQDRNLVGFKVETT